MFIDVGFVSGRVRRVRISVGTCLRGRFIVGTCVARSALCRDVFGEVELVLGRVRRSRLSFGTCPERSA